MDKVAKGIGLARASSYQRYEDEVLFKDRYLSLEMAEKLLKVFVGKGDPPIEAGDVMMLAGINLDSEGRLESVELWAAPGLGLEAARQVAERLDSPSDVRPAGDMRVDPRSWPLDVPVLGTAQAGADGDFEMNGEVIDRVRRPPGISNSKDVFAIYVQGDSMVPWKEPGDLVYVQGHRPARPGDYVVIQMKAAREGDVPRAYLKRLVRSAGPSIIVEQFNPPIPDMPIPTNRVDRIFRVMTLNELMGI